MLTQVSDLLSLRRLLYSMMSNRFRDFNKVITSVYLGDNIESGCKMKNNQRKIEQFVFIFMCFCFGVILYLLGLFLWSEMGKYSESAVEFWIYSYGWLGIIIYTFVLISWKKSSDIIFSPYIIFFTFVVLFNYGQFILWALGIHYIGELGTTTFIRYMDKYTLLKIEIVSSVSMLSFHFGALISSFGRKIYSNDSKNLKIINDKEYYYKAIKIVSTYLALISVPVAIILSYQNLLIAVKFGYTSIYYGNNIHINPLVKYLSYMFFPSLLGILIGNKFSKKSFILVGGIFTTYLLINLLAGDRGSWIYYLFILIWCYFTYIKRPTIFTVIKYLILGSMFLICATVLVQFREIGFVKITRSDFLHILQDLPYVFVKPFFEMGQSARVLGIVIQDNLDASWNFGNTYMAAILSMFIPRIKVWFGYPDFYIDNWISQSYLGLDNYGVGFSITAEAYLNGGLFLSPFIMILVGMFIGYLLSFNSNSITNPIRMFVVLSSASSLAMMARGSMELNLRVWAYGTLIMLAMVLITKWILIKYTISQNHPNK